MAKQELTCDDILKELGAKQYRPVYYLMGEESYYIDLIADYITNNVLNETEKEFNLTVVYGADADVATVINAAKRYPMMSEHQVVVVKEAQAIRNMEELSYYLQKPLLSTILVICHKHGTLDRRKKLAAEIEKVVVNDIKVLYDNELKLKDYTIEKNDAGNQVNNLAKSVEARYLLRCGKEAEVPENGYHGQDIINVADKIYNEIGDKYASDPDSHLDYFKKLDFDCVLFLT